MHFVGAIPEGYRPPSDVLDVARRYASDHGGSVRIVADPHEAARGAEVLYTDVWVSMGDEAQEKARLAAFRGYTIDASLLASAAPGCRVMHDLPAHRGLEITDEVMDGPASIVFDQAENRLHAQKAILERLLGSR
jgi:ornithine carbamoyltransferase